MTRKHHGGMKFVGPNYILVQLDAMQVFRAKLFVPITADHFCELELSLKVEGDSSNQQAQKAPAPVSPGELPN